MQNKYIQIYNEIVDEIRQGIYEAQSKLPSEHDFMVKYDTSRETIRKALNLLSQNGYIQKVQGKGSIVLDARKFDFPISGLVSFKELAGQLGDSHHTHVEKLEMISPNKDIREILKLSKDGQVWEVYRVREIDKERIILDKDYFNKNYIDNLTKEICSNSIYEYIEKELGLSISFAKKEITVVEPTEEDKQLLDLEGYHNIVVVKNYVYFDDASIFQYTESRHRPDKFRFVDFARRTHK
ncbi:trehalose operon repressor [Evansella cellulosilytica]|uniref:Trehalose operon repressor n=1 Tax=Evansella cellulosilytica (strain ATCC 21833 / DSM 2522 / FERM P-1141 / JCM 9156 / N-4) TaxID=649639 RepID=E6U1F1_EVAC2|nr:trehalose operon repressor [Evansella cellulosilytica]ADU29198.1 transcriptional regulator, GntR family [Evansella cellulosilytica DSM 2522]